MHRAPCPALTSLPCTQPTPSREGEAYSSRDAAASGKRFDGQEGVNAIYGVPRPGFRPCPWAQDRDSDLAHGPQTGIPTLPMDPRPGFRPCPWIQDRDSDLAPGSKTGIPTLPLDPRPEFRPCPWIQDRDSNLSCPTHANAPPPPNDQTVSIRVDTADGRL